VAAGSSRQSGVLLLLAGLALMWLAWRWRAGGGLAVVQAAVAGPLSVLLGLGLLIHGERMPRYGMSRLTRRYGIAGGLAGAACLWVITGYAEAPTGRARWLLPVLATVVWLVPIPAPTRDEPGPSA
jgi:HAMP domain-containing protein